MGSEDRRKYAIAQEAQFNRLKEQSEAEDGGKGEYRTEPADTTTAEEYQAVPKAVETPRPRSNGKDRAREETRRSARKAMKQRQSEKSTNTQ